MALKINTTVPATDETINAYANIDYLRIKKDADKVMVTVLVTYYASALMKEVTKIMKADRFIFPLDLESNDNAYIQAYNYLKTLSEFEDAVDC